MGRTALRSQFIAVRVLVEILVILVATGATAKVIGERATSRAASEDGGDPDGDTVIALMQLRGAFVMFV